MTEYALPDVAPPTPSALDDVLGMRRNTLARKVKLLDEQIETTRENFEEALKQIDYDLCACGTIEANLPFGANQERDKIILSSKLPLYKERRQRSGEFLRDTAMLRRDILDTILQYQALEDQQKLLQ